LEKSARLTKSHSSQFNQGTNLRALDEDDDVSATTLGTSSNPNNNGGSISEVAAKGEGEGTAALVTLAALLFPSSFQS